MKDAATARGKGFQDRRGAGGNRREDRKNILDRGNELKDLLKGKELAFSGDKNELVS